MEQFKEWLEILSLLATIIGIPLAIYIFHRDKVIERKQNAREALLNSHLLYVDYLKICLDNSELEVYDTAYFNPDI